MVSTVIPLILSALALVLAGTAIGASWYMITVSPVCILHRLRHYQIHGDDVIRLTFSYLSDNIYLSKTSDQSDSVLRDSFYLTLIYTFMMIGM